jgi:hypothetical protein
LKAKGAEIVEGEVDSSVAELTKVAQGSDTVVSVISGNALFSGQEAKLVQAAKAAGVKRFVPSQYGVDTSVLR